MAVQLIRHSWFFCVNMKPLFRSRGRIFHGHIQIKLPHLTVSENPYSFAPTVFLCGIHQSIFPRHGNQVN